MSASMPVLLGHDHLDDLPSSADKLRESAGLRIGERADFRFGGRDEGGNHRGIDRIGLGALAQGIGEEADLGRIDDDDRKAGRRQGRHRQRLQTSRRLERHDIGIEGSEPFDQIVQSDMVVGEPETIAGRQDMHIQPILRNIDTDDLIHLLPSLPNRASLSQAALATVRVRWNGGRRPLLSHGLGVPKVLRSPVRHRSSQTTKFCNSGKRQVTR